MLLWSRPSFDAAKEGAIHRLAIDIRQAKYKKTAGAIASRIGKRLFYNFFWPVVLCFKSLRIVWRNGRHIKKQYNLSWWYQWYHCTRLAIRLNMEHDSYYKFRLWDKANSHKAIKYVQHHEIIKLLPYLNRALDLDKIDNKDRFYEACASLKLPTIPIILKQEPAEAITWYAENNRLPHRDLFVKYSNMCCGYGAESWQYVATEGGQWKRGDLLLDETALLNYCGAKSQETTVIIQPQVRNHPCIAKYSHRGLCTLRVVTYKLPGQAPEILITSWRMPRGNEDTDNFAAGGIAAGVSHAGKLMPAVGKSVLQGPYSRHPDTNAQIEGATLARFHDMTALALAAHTKFSEPIFLGWDVALTEDGPLLVEANSTWCVDLVQMANNKPILETAFGDVLMQALKTT